MTTMLDPDQTSNNPQFLPFAPGDLDRYRLRMTRADFARLTGVSKTAVTDWVRKGWIVLGPDGLLDPKAAMRQLLRHVDPSRLRAKALAPMIVDAAAQARRIVELERRLASALEDVQFERDAGVELIQQNDALVHHLLEEWDLMRAQTPEDARAMFRAWIAAGESSIDPGPLSAFIPLRPVDSALGAPQAEEGGGGYTS